MFINIDALGAGSTASPAPEDVIEALHNAKGCQPSTVTENDSNAFPEANLGTWFDEGYDFREPAGTHLTKAVLAEIAKREDRKRKRRDDDQRNFETLVRKLLANAIRGASYHSPTSIAVLRGASAYGGKPAYLSGKAIKRATDLLADAGLVELSVGAVGQGATIYSAQPDLMFLALDAGATERSISYRMPPERVIRLRKGNRHTQLLSFQHNDESQGWADALNNYNSYLAEQDICLALNREESTRLVARMNERRSTGKLPYDRPEQTRTCLYRQFNNGSFNDGGRLYGGWWQTCPKDLRSKITINGSPTVELDFSGCLIRMIYHMAHIDYRDDPYWLEPLDRCERANGLPEGHFRDPIKLMMQALINGQEGRKNERIRLPTGKTFKPFFTRKEIMDLLIVKHSLIADSFLTGAGLQLQKLESDIVLEILKSLQLSDVPSLPVHDSLIVAAEKKDKLKEAMVDCYKQRIGYDPLIK